MACPNPSVPGRVTLKRGNSWSFLGEKDEEDPGFKAFPNSLEGAFWYPDVCPSIRVPSRLNPSHCSLFLWAPGQIATPKQEVVNRTTSALESPR